MWRARPPGSGCSIAASWSAWRNPAYARAVFSDGGDITGEDLDRSVTERIARQVILNTGRDITLLMTKGRSSGRRPARR